MANSLKQSASQLIDLVETRLIGRYNSISVGISGGIDSVCLLHILSLLQAKHNLTLSAIHINHGISPNANFWGEFCQKFCDSLSIPLVIKHHQITKNGGESLENNARNIRYLEFAQIDAPVIALAHHQDDLVETVLSQILRGSDLHNVAAMDMLSNKRGKILWRPLLDITRSQIEEYAKEFNLNYINDESNSDTKYLRNFIRHDIIPKLNQFDPNVASKILKFKQQVSSTITLIDQIAKDDLAQISQDNYLDLDKFKYLSLERQINLLSYYLVELQMKLPSQLQLKEFATQASSSAWDRKPSLKLDGGNYNLIKFKNKIYIE